MEQARKNMLRALPAVHEVLAAYEKSKEFAPYLANEVEFKRLTEVIRQAIQNLRENILSEDKDLGDPFTQTSASAGSVELKEIIGTWLKNKVLCRLQDQPTSIKRVINATGVVLHTNCGRAVLAPQVRDLLTEQAGCYSNLELDLTTGERGSRYVHVEKILCDLTGAEAAMVVNNNAAAVLLVMNTLAQGKEVIVSRGELVEVGGSFRIPEVLKAGGAKLVEVGSTNKTWLKDYEEAISSETAMLLKVHTSNYRIEGFVNSVPGKELVDLAKKYDLPVVEDLGSGSFLDGISLGLPAEPTIAQTVKAGLSLVTFSGDKLLGGPQAGIIVGTKKFIEKLRKNQLTRALRIDKLSLTALEGTLRLYEAGRFQEIPVWRMLSFTPEELKARALALSEALQGLDTLELEVKEDFSQVGGGAWPTVDLPTWVCALRSQRGSAQELEAFLRAGSVPVLTRIKKDSVYIDPRTLLEGDAEEIVERLKQW